MSSAKIREQRPEAPTLNATNVPWHNPYTLVRNPVLNGRSLDYYRYDGKPLKGTDAELTAMMSSVTVEAVHDAITKARAHPGALPPNFS